MNETQVKVIGVLATMRGVETAIGLLGKTTSLHEHHAFLYISLPLLHNYNVKMPNFYVLWRTYTTDDEIFFSF